MRNQMKIRASRAALCVVIFLALGAVAPAADTYKVDPVHSMVMFRAVRMGVANIYGRFNVFSGTFTVDETNPAASSIEIEVRTESVDTGAEGRDNHLRSPDFFNAKQFPTMTFKSTAVKSLGGDEFEVTGNYTLLGVTKPITARVVRIGSGTDRRSRAKTMGLEATFTVKRTDFGMKFMAGPLSDEIQVTVAVRGVAQ